MLVMAGCQADSGGHPQNLVKYRQIYKPQATQKLTSWMPPLFKRSLRTRFLRQNAYSDAHASMVGQSAKGVTVEPEDETGGKDELVETMGEFFLGFQKVGRFEGSI